MLFDRNRVVGTAFDGRVVGHDHAFAAGDPADTGDDAGAGACVVVHPVGGERRDFEQRTTRIKQTVDAVAGQQFATVDVATSGAFRATQGGRGQLVAQLLDERGVRVAVLRRRGHRLHANFG